MKGQQTFKLRPFHFEFCLKMGVLLFQLKDLLLLLTTLSIQIITLKMKQTNKMHTGLCVNTLFLSYWNVNNNCNNLHVFKTATC